jgi:hypothetical protein
MVSKGPCALSFRINLDKSKKKKIGQFYLRSSVGWGNLHGSRVRVQLRFELTCQGHLIIIIFKKMFWLFSFWACFACSHMTWPRVFVWDQGVHVGCMSKFKHPGDDLCHCLILLFRVSLWLEDCILLPPVPLKSTGLRCVTWAKFTGEFGRVSIWMFARVQYVTRCDTQKVTFSDSITLFSSILSPSTRFWQNRWVLPEPPDLWDAELMQNVMQDHKNLHLAE